MKLRLAVLQPHVHLRAGADHSYRLAVRAVARQFQEVHVGAGVGHAQRPVDGERVGLGLAGQALAEHHLEDVAGRDVLLGLEDHGFEALLVKVALPRRVAEDVGRLGDHQRLAQPRHDLVDAGDGIGVGRGQVALQPAVGQNNQPVAHVVEDHQVVGQQEDEGWQVQVVAGGLRQLLHEAHPVVA